MLENLNSTELVLCLAVFVAILFASGYFGARAVMRRTHPVGLDSTAGVMAERFRNGELTRDEAIAGLAACYPAVPSSKVNAAFNRGLQATR